MEQFSIESLAEKATKKVIKKHGESVLKAMLYRLEREEIIFQMTNISIMRLLPLLLIKIIRIITIVLAICSMIFYLEAQSNDIPHHIYLYIAHHVRRGLELLFVFFIRRKKESELNLLL